MDVRTLLEREGVSWGKRMDCPRCLSPKKVTARGDGSIAQCWYCHVKWIPNQEAMRGNWAVNLMRSLAEKCQEALQEGTPAYEWLTDNRGLPADARWLRAHYLGCIPQTMGVNGMLLLAKEQLAVDKEEGLEKATKKNAKELIEIEFGMLERRLSNVTEVINKLTDTQWHNAVVYIYVDDQEQPVSLHVRQFSAEENGKKLMMTVQPLLKCGVFCPIPYPGVAWADSFPAIITEGEHNWLSLCQISDAWNKDGRFALAGMAVGGKNAVDCVTVKALAGHRPLVLYDNDAVNPETGKPGGWDLVTTLNSTMGLCAATTPVKDADEWLRGGERILPNHLRSLIKSAEFLCIPPAIVGATIHELRLKYAVLKTPEWKTTQDCTSLLWDSLQDRAVIYNAGNSVRPAQGLLLVDLPEGGRHTTEVDPKSETWDRLLLEYSLEPSDALTQKMARNIWQRTVSHPRVAVSILSHYDLSTKTLYVYRGNGQMLVLTPDGEVQTKKNGDDQVVFLKHFAQPPKELELGTRGVGLGRKHGLFEQLISDTVLWDSETGLAAEDQKLLLRVHFFHLFFDTLISMKLCPVFEGPGGAGKNTVTTRIGRFFEGPSFAVQHMPDDEDKLNQKSANRLYAGFDEYDSSDHQMESAFRSWSTTMVAETRKLYTEFGKVVAPLARGASLSTNYNPIREAATSRRQLTFFVRERDEQGGYRSPAADLWPEFDRQTEALWAEVIADLRIINQGLAKVDPMPVHHSMSDFGVFMMRCATAEGWEADCKRIITCLTDLQNRVVSSKSFWVSKLQEVLTEHPELTGKPLTAKEWVGWVKQIVPHDDKEGLARLRDTSFALYCSRGGKQVMIRAFKMSTDWPKVANNVRYSFCLPDDDADVV